MLDSLSLLALGFFLGVPHAADPDHVVAVSTIVSRNRSLVRASLTGALWGAGHTVTVLLVGGAIILLRWSVPPRLGLTMELAVAVMLIGLGAYNLSRAREHAVTSSDQHARPVLVGLVHGLAGSAAVALLVLTSARDPWVAIASLLLFGLGTVAGMMLVTVALALPATWALRRFTRAHQWLRIGSGAVALGFGLFLAWQIGFVDGLFTATPVWTPK